MKQTILLSLAALILMSVPACKKVPFYATEGATLIISTNKTFLKTGADRATLTVMGFSASGDAMHDHTMVMFTSTLGTVTPAEVEIMGGRATVEFVSGNFSGVAEIQARSGTILAEPNPLTINIGSAALETLSMSATPTTLPPGGGQVRVRVFAYDANGNLLPDIPVILSTTAGYFSQGKSVYTTNENGLVEDWLHTSATADVSAESGGQKVEMEIKVEEEEENLPPSAVISYSPASPQKGETIYFNGSLSTDSDGSIVRYHWDFGDGQSSYGEKVQHRYTWDGTTNKTFTVVLKVMDNRGGEAAVTRDITVTAI
jgi:hypothetical protein